MDLETERDQDIRDIYREVGERTATQTLPEGEPSEKLKLDAKLSHAKAEDVLERSETEWLRERYAEAETYQEWQHLNWTISALASRRGVRI